MTDIDVLLRAAGPDDLDAMWQIESEVFGADAWSRELMREELSASQRVYLVLLDGSDTVRGYGGVLIVGEECDVQTIAVAAELRGAGHGRSLMLALLEAARLQGATQCFLEVRADNPVARALYESLGFTEIGVRPGYYQPDNVDAIVMKLEMETR